MSAGALHVCSAQPGLADPRPLRGLQLGRQSFHLLAARTAEGFTPQTLAFGFVGLACVSVKNPHNHWPELFLQLCASRRVPKFNAFAFATNKAGFPKNPEMLRQGGFGKLQVTIGQEGGAVHGAVSLGQICVNASPDRVGEGVQDALHGYFFQRRMIKWPHKKSVPQLDMIVQEF
jgi:hypothetical protein